MLIINNNLITQKYRIKLKLNKKEGAAQKWHPTQESVDPPCESRN